MTHRGLLSPGVSLSPWLSHPSLQALFWMICPGVTTLFCLTRMIGGCWSPFQGQVIITLTASQHCLCLHLQLVSNWDYDPGRRGIFGVSQSQIKALGVSKNEATLPHVPWKCVTLVNPGAPLFVCFPMCFPILFPCIAKPQGNEVFVLLRTEAFLT